jgi:hypothetical protein
MATWTCIYCGTELQSESDLRTHYCNEKIESEREFD